ncbi:bucentaur or craniofacial development-domain-containing protein [Xylariaceae sp. FL1272]|nr:bucentaur or craniofacial development-domain-containing protein [Xylariaceae sp. FL1272]
MALEPVMDEDYASEEDSDFLPDAAPADAASESESEPDDGQPSTVPRTATPKQNDAEAAHGDFENSGDEAIIQKGKTRQKKSKRLDGDDGGEGGLVKTRSQRAQEKAERKSYAATGPVTINVDELWAQMTAAPILQPKPDTDRGNENEKAGDKDIEISVDTNVPDKANVEPSEMIKIKRTYNFAGKVHTEEKLVPRDSAEARLYLASQDPKLADSESNDDRAKPKPRKAFRSIFEPMFEGAAQRDDLKLGLNLRLQLREQQAKAKKLNVVEKSRMDWAGFVDKEGIKNELELAGKSKESYANRQDFLLRVEAKKEDEARRARMAARG